ncbi:MAG: ketoacyl-ACP synthase III [Prevotellaceae bacterium]|jgi:3-oxoacyl-[acyl-carrier-protein] synthase-3|nr:ketoacyl-ACP synthase III [Prevotellaceae bacterium]
MIPIAILGTGLYAPGEAINNAELKKLANIEFDSQKTEEKIGIYQRHIAHLRGISETTADFVTHAAKEAIKNAGIAVSEAGLFIVATDTPEFITPATAIVAQGRIQQSETWSMAFDVGASCASFAMAFDTAASILNTNPHIKYAVITGVYNMPAFIRPDDAFGYSIFADGAAAFVLGRKNENQDSTYIGSQMLTDGTQWDYIGIYVGGAKNPVTHELIDSQKHGLLSLQPLPGDRNVRLWPMIVEKILKKYNCSANEIDHYIFTQINKSVIVKVMDAIGQPLEKAHFVMNKYGYTGSACLPMAFHEGVKNGRIQRGDKILFVASGAGLSVGSNLFIY